MQQNDAQGLRAAMIDLCKADAQWTVSLQK
jgi:hypothetical protein